MRALRQIGILVWKDLLIDLRRKEHLLSMFFFALLTLIIFRFALGGEEASRYQLTPMVLQGLQEEHSDKPLQQWLKPLLDQSFPTRKTFLAALNALVAKRMDPQARLRVMEESQRGPMQDSAPGLLWVTFLFAGLLGLGKSFSQEQENGCMTGLLLTPMPRGVLYLGKLLSTTIFLGLIVGVLLPLFGLFFNLHLGRVLPSLSVVLLGGIVGFTSLGTLLGGLTASLKGREVLLPLLLFPLISPLVLVAVHLSSVVLEGGPLLGELPWLRLLAAIDGVFLIVSYLIFDVVMES